MTNKFSTKFLLHCFRYFQARLGARYLHVSNAISNDAADVTLLLYFCSEVTIDGFCVTLLQWWLSPIAGSLIRYNGGYR